MPITHLFDSSGDSSGFTADQSKQQYTDAVAKKPISLLALNHDVKGMSHSIHFFAILTDALHPRTICVSLSSSGLNILSHGMLDTTSSLMQLLLSRKQVTNWSHWRNVVRLALLSALPRAHWPLLVGKPAYRKVGPAPTVDVCLILYLSGHSAELASSLAKLGHDTMCSITDSFSISLGHTIWTRLTLLRDAQTFIPVDILTFVVNEIPSLIYHLFGTFTFEFHLRCYIHFPVLA